jgi:4'-phosphopantetheinyl transferase
VKKAHQPPRPGPQEITWPYPQNQEHSELTPGDVHVWALDLDSLAAHTGQHAQLLSPAERQRAGRFHFDADRRRFISRRWALRTLLVRYLQIPPGRLHFVHNPYGKPALPAELGDVTFNISHSAGLALLAFSRGRQIGVDIERLRPDFDYKGILGRYFSDAEQAALWRLPPSQQRAAFFAGWARKEAYIKAHGEGLSLALEAFDVTISTGPPARLLATRHDPADAGRWQLRHLAPSPGYPAALAVEGDGWQLKCRQMATLKRHDT